MSLARMPYRAVYWLAAIPLILKKAGIGVSPLAAFEVDKDATEIIANVIANMRADAPGRGLDLFSI